MNTLATLDWLVIGLYFAILIGIVIAATRHQMQLCARYALRYISTHIGPKGGRYGSIRK